MNLQSGMSGAFGFGQPTVADLMFCVGVLALGRVLWWIRILHTNPKVSGRNLHVGFLSLPVSDRPADSTLLPITRCWL